MFQIIDLLKKQNLHRLHKYFDHYLLGKILVLEYLKTYLIAQRKIKNTLPANALAVDRLQRQLVVTNGFFFPEQLVRDSLQCNDNINNSKPANVS